MLEFEHVLESSPGDTNKRNEVFVLRVSCTSYLDTTSCSIKVMQLDIYIVLCSALIIRTFMKNYTLIESVVKSDYDLYGHLYL